MSQIFADCPTHGVFRSNDRAIRVEHATVNFKGGTLRCAKCGQKSTIISGTYQFQGYEPTQVALRPTPVQLGRLQTALAWAQQELDLDGADEAKVEAKIRRTLEKDAPHLTSMVDTMFGAKGAGLAAWIAVMLTIMQMLTNSNSPELTPEFIEQVIEQVQKGQGDDGWTRPSQPAPKERQSPREPEEPLIVKT